MTTKFLIIRLRKSSVPFVLPATTNGSDAGPLRSSHSTIDYITQHQTRTYGWCTWILYHN